MDDQDHLPIANVEQRVSALSPERRALLAQLLRKKTPHHEANAVPANDRPPNIVPAPAERFAPFPLRDLQQAYWIGRSGAFELGDVASHSYLEIERPDLDVQRLNMALQRLIEHHDMLRAVVLPDGLQQVLQEVPPYEIQVWDWRGQPSHVIASHLEDIRQHMSHQVLPSHTWPLFDIQASRLDGQRVRLHISLDALVFDGWSIFLFLRQWAQLYTDPTAALALLTVSFRDYVLGELALRGTEAYQRARAYWQARVPMLPAPPQLPLAKRPGALTTTRFVRRVRRLEPASWSQLKARAAKAGLTPTVVLLAAYADVLALWSNSTQFTLNVPRFNRLPLHPQIDQLLGEFASFTLLAVENMGQDTFAERARRLHQQLWENLDHSHYSGVDVLRELTQGQQKTPGAVMPVVFTAAAKDKDGADAYITTAARELGEVVFAINQTSQVWLDNHISEQDGALVCDWDTVDEIFPEGLAEDMLEAYLRLLQRLADEEGSWQERWPETARRLMPSTQLAQREAINALEAEVPEQLLHTLCAAQVHSRAAQPAVVSARRTLTYAELSCLSNQWGRRLRQMGACPNTLVAVVMEKGWEQIVAVLGILHSGAAYLPIDAQVPAERLAYLLEDGAVELVLTQSWLDESLDWPTHIQRLCVDCEELAEVDPHPLEPLQQPDDLACVIYTSGSTGVPKGVMITHRAVLNAILYTNQSFRIGADDKVLAVTALHHDMSFYDIFGILTAGGTLVVPEASGKRDPAYWSALMQQEQVTLWNSVPAMMEMLLEYVASRPGAMPQSLRVAFLGGDWIPLALPDRLRQHVAHAQVVSVGGPTETTLWNIWYPINTIDPAWQSIPYGKPIANTRYYVLSEALVDCPTWVPGELYCAGVGVTKGYWRDEEMTRAKYILHPATEERLYRTGDLGRYLPDGNLEFLGRVDFQVKIHGQRIELGEIEAVLQRHPAVHAAAVKVVEEQHGKKRLAAYVVPEKHAVLAPSDLSAFLRETLPPHMVPTAFVLLEQLLLTANGKVDRRALPNPVENIPAPVRNATVNSSETLPKIVRLVADVLKIDGPDPDANLLCLGANSLDMVRIGNRLEQEFGARLRIDELFRLQTIRALAGYYEPVQYQEQAPAGTVEARIASYSILLDPEERDVFKKQQPGIRKGNDGKPFVQLLQPVQHTTLQEKYLRRRSRRRFGQTPIPFEQFGEFLSCLSQISLDNTPKYLYASPGGLYPGQVYLHVKTERVQGVLAGTYYYHPVDHRLILLTANAEIDRGIHIPFINTPIFDQAAFSIFLITQLSAIAPAYGERSLHFATLEAGIMAHLLETAAAESGIGLCQIGSVEFDRIRHLFDLDEMHILLHSLLGGLIEPHEPSSWSSSQETLYYEPSMIDEHEEGVI